MTRIALITGVAGGIGRATAAELRAGGCRVFGIDLAPASVPEGIEFIEADVADPNAVARSVEAIAARTNYLDVLVNNAAVCPSAKLEDTSPELWERVLAVNLTGPFLLIKAVLPLLKRSSRAAIVNVASVHALGTSEGVAAYAASKGGLVSFTRAAALELAESGIRVNCVLPGAVSTPMLTDGFRARHPDGGSVEEQMERLAGQTPLNKIGSPEEIAKAICFLCAAEDSSFITGQTLVVDGGALARLSTE